MRGKLAKMIRSAARDNTIGESDAATRKEYKRLKKIFKASRKPSHGCPKPKGYSFARGRPA